MAGAQHHHLLVFIFFLLLQGTVRTLAQSSPADAPAPPGPTNVTKILEKAGQFTIFIRLLKATEVADQLYGQLNDSNNGITIFAPADNAFSSLKSGVLNSLSNEQQVALVQFHVIPSYVSTSNFQTVTNPLRTQAGDSADGHFPLNVTTSGNSINITTGVTNTSVSGSVYSDGQLAIYQVDQVLLPQEIFDPISPAPAPEGVKEKKKEKGTPADSTDDGGSTSGSSPPVVLNFAVPFWVIFASFGWIYL